jgi:uncharacterized protein YacL
MITSIYLIRIVFVILCTLFSTSYAILQTTEGLTFANITLGLAGGLLFSFGVIAVDICLKQINLKIFNIAILGLFFGYVFGEAVVLILNTAVQLDNITDNHEILNLVRTGIFLFSIYFGMILTARGADEIYLSIPFVRLKPSNQNKKDIIVDASALFDPRVVDLAVSGLLDHQLIIPRFLVKELNSQLESPDESTKIRARRSLETLKKLEAIPSLELRYNETDFAELKDTLSKLIRLARVIDANIITADISKVQQALIEGIRFINIHLLSNALKPLTQTGEFLTIKVLRYGKEPGQGVGYLDDGTMVVVNGGAEFINETIRAQVISVKNNPTGRMIFCNAIEESMHLMSESKATIPELESTHKSYFAL